MFFLLVKSFFQYDAMASFHSRLCIRMKASSAFPIISANRPTDPHTLGIPALPRVSHRFLERFNWPTDPKLPEGMLSLYACTDI